MKKFVVENGYEVDNCGYHDGCFWWLEEVPRVWVRGTATTNGGYAPRSRPLAVCNSLGERFTFPTTPGQDRMHATLAIDTNKKICVYFHWLGCVGLDGKKTLTSAGESPLAHETEGFRTEPRNHDVKMQEWHWSVVKCKLPMRDASEKRRSYNDAHVVLTGNGAHRHCPMLMGPTAAEAVMKTKGIKTGHVVAYRRGGDYRVMKLEGKDNPIAVCVAGDGLTFAAVCMRAIYVIDIDV